MTTQGDLALMHANGMSFADVLALHAHLLAEQIRQYADDRLDVGVHNQWHEGAHDGADEIDPAVSDR